MKHLVIVESPTKARTIGKFLGSDYEIRPSMGHVMDLPKSKLGIDLEHDFLPLYEIMPDKLKIVTELRSLAKKTDMVLLATDPDREGEAIASNIKDILSSSSKSKVQSLKFRRIVFHEITEEAILDAVKNPREVDTNLVNAQTARRILDRLVGYQLSPLLWKKVRRGLSAGRVQSVALRLIAEREREIEKFGKETYYTIFADLGKSVIASKAKQSQAEEIASSPGIHRDPRNDNNVIVRFELISINDKKIETSQTFTLYDGEYKVSKTTIEREKSAHEIVSELQGAQFIVADVIQKQAKRSPQPPFTTSTLQQDASRRFGYPGKRTMSIAQKLYEEGFITYHRTDSVLLAATAIDAIRGFVKKEYGEKYVPETPRSYSAKQKLAQEAHEAIRPTKVTTNGKMVEASLGRDYGRIYDLIWRRTVASQMSDALIESTSVLVDAVPVVIASKAKQSQDIEIAASQAPRNDNTVYRLKANGSVLVFEGFLKINPQALQDTKLPQFEMGEKLKDEKVEAEKHETPPPPRYNDASLIGTLEERGIGRPSTYASIIGTITDRAYVERVEKKFIPTSIGIAVNDFLVKNFSSIDDIPFTAGMEDELDEVASGKQKWEKMMKDFYTPFAKKLKEVEGAERVKIAVEDTGEICPTCKEGTLVIRTGKFGKFLSCSRFPECKFTKPYAQDTGVVCPKDQGKVIQKKTKKGRPFYGCSNYPNCDFAAWKLEDIPGYKKDTHGQSDKESGGDIAKDSTTAVV